MFKGFRFLRGLTVEEFAEQAGIPKALAEIFERHMAKPTKAELQDMATALDTSIFELLEPSHASGHRLILPPMFEWDGAMQRKWGALPHLHWGYLCLQLGPTDSPQWHPVSGEQAASIDKQFHDPGWATMIVARTKNNRCIMFAPQRVTSARLIDKLTALEMDSFQPLWDADGHPAEVYRGLRAWGQKDSAERSGSSFHTASRIHDFLRSGTTYTRKKIIALVDHSIVHHIDGRVIRFSATASSLYSAVRAVQLGSFTAYLDEYDGDREYLAIIDDVRAIDLPATDLKLLSRAVLRGETKL